MYRVAHQDAVSAIRVIGTVLVSASFDRLVRCFEMEVSLSCSVMLH